MAALLIFWPVWFLMVALGSAIFARDPSRGGFAFLAFLALLGCFQAFMTWRLARSELQGWMARRDGGA